MPNIIIYTSPICFECERAKKYFKHNDIAYEEIDVTENTALAEQAFRKAGKKRIPLILIGDKAFPGFDKKRIEEHLR